MLIRHLFNTSLRMQLMFQKYEYDDSDNIHTILALE